MQAATVYSVYMINVAPEIVKAQRSVIDAMLPVGWKFVQYKADSYSHPAALTVCCAMNTKPITIFLDIDCVPLSQAALELMADRAERGILVGAAQRANHIENNQHIYIGPFCMGFNNRKYMEMGSPTFYETSRGDAGEELTYRWQEKQQPLYLMWPSRVISPLWQLTDGVQFGLGTTYAEMFYHEFCARQQVGNFVEKCNQLVPQSLKGISA